jgi:hypothetical protein
MTTLLLFQDDLRDFPFIENRELVFLSPAPHQTGHYHILGMSLDYTFNMMSRGSSVGIATGYGLDE